MKKQFLAVVCILLVVFCFVFVACDSKPEPITMDQLQIPQMGNNECVVVVVNNDGTYTLCVVRIGKDVEQGASVEQVLLYLNDNTNLYLDWTSSSYGKYINGIGGAIVEESNEFVTVLTSIQSQQATGAWVKTVNIPDYGTVVSASQGVEGLSVEPGCVILFMIDTY